MRCGWFCSLSHDCVREHPDIWDPLTHCHFLAIFNKYIKILSLNKLVTLNSYFAAKFCKVRICAHKYAQTVGTKITARKKALKILSSFYIHWNWVIIQQVIYNYTTSFILPSRNFEISGSSTIHQAYTSLKSIPGNTHS